MVLFDQLRISDDGKRMFINVHINKAVDGTGKKLFENIFLDSITIVTADKVESETDPYCIAVEADNIYNYTFKENVSEANLIVDISDLQEAYTNSMGKDCLDNVNPNCTNCYNKKNFSDDLFFVYVKCRIDGETNPCLENLQCSLTELITLGVTFDENLLYQRVMDYTKELADKCTVSKGFVDFILLWNAFKASIETEHYIPAIKYYKMLFGKGGVNSPYGESSRIYNKNCRCHG